MSIYRLNQLRTPLTVEMLKPDTFIQQLRQSSLQTWASRQAFSHNIFLCRQERWEEDAFCIPVQLIKQLHLMDCVHQALYFQDLFDLLLLLEDKPYCRNIAWIHLGMPVIYHLNHPRYFYEYSRSFLDTLTDYPEVFSHLALYDLAHSELHYHEPFVDGSRQINMGKISRLAHFMKYADRGTMTLWSSALDHANGQ